MRRRVECFDSNGDFIATVLDHHDRFACRVLLIPRADTPLYENYSPPIHRDAVYRPGHPGDSMSVSLLTLLKELIGGVYTLHLTPSLERQSWVLR